jgi:hypothetical protein
MKGFGVGHAEVAAAACEVMSLAGRCGDPVVANALEAPRQDVLEEAFEQYSRADRQDALSVPMSGVAPAQPYVSTVEAEKPVVGQGDAVKRPR